MNTSRDMNFFLEDGLRQSAQAGQHNFINKVADVLSLNGFNVDFRPMSERGSGGYALTHMKPPEVPHGLTFRRVYHYPFWQIDSTDKRWNWRVAGARFDPEMVDEKEAARFYNFWRKRLFDLTEQSASEGLNKGYVYMPLQGKLAQHRSFQSCSPLEMIERTLDAMPDRKIIATLHPKEEYSKPEQEALERLVNKHKQLDLRIGKMEELLAGCDCVVTQNSSAAFNGYFFGKPAILFGKPDFHHIALDGMAADSFAKIAGHQPDFARYIWWFWQGQSINAGHPSAAQKIEDRLRTFGWIT